MIAELTSSGVLPRRSGPAGWHALPADAVAAALGTGPDGLTEAGAAARQRAAGPNAVATEKGPAWPAVLLRQFASPLIYVLVFAALVSVTLGDLVDAGVIAFVLLLNAGIGFVQEWRAERAVRALLEMGAPRARVIRAGRERTIPSRELVPGDLVLLESGARVPADLRLVNATALLVDESLLTGEAAAVAKRLDVLPAETPVTDRRNLTFAGTVVRSGRGRGYVVAIGAATALGAIAQAVRDVSRVEPPLRRRLARLGRVLTAVVVVAAAVTFLFGVATGRSVAEMFLVAVALAVSAVPEGLPVAATVALAIGVRRMARRHAIVRRLASVETLGSTTVIGADKTGTLTENRMTAVRVWAGGAEWRFPGAEGDAPTATPADLADRPELALALLTGVLTNEAQDDTGDPTEVALLRAALALELDPAAARAAWRPLAELPFEPELQRSAALRQRGEETALFVKGAPELLIAESATLLEHGGQVPLPADQVRAAAAALGARGLRVLALAYRPNPGPDALADPDDLVFLGLIGLRDPPRAGVRAAVAECRAAGVRVVMITGDHAETALAIARDVGIAEPRDRALTGADLARLDDAALDLAVGHVAVFARVSPADKLRIVEALRRMDEVVAVTGDGVNDAPALRAAHLGVAMGRTGTDVAREAADMVLADDDFVTITAAVRQGRVTFDNIRKVTYFLVSTNVAEVAAILGALMLGWPLLLIAVQLLWLNLVTEGFQGIALAFEPGERDVLRRPPRAPREGILSPLLWQRTVLVGAIQAGGTLGLFGWELARGAPLAVAQTVALTTLVLFQVFQLGNARAERASLLTLPLFSNPYLLGATALAVLTHVAALYLPLTQRVLRVVPIGLDAWAAIAAVAGTVLLAAEIDKAIRRRHPSPPVAREAP